MSVAAIGVRRATTADAGAFARIHGDVSVLSNLMQLPYTSEEVWAQRLADLNMPSKAGQDLLLVAERDAQVVGTAGLHVAGPQVRRRHAMYVGLSVAREAQGLGVGTALMQALVDYADRWAHVLRLELTVYVDNARAIALYRKFGFEVEGTHRAYALRDGAYVDALFMARLHPSPPTWGRPAPAQP
jgi:L-phenylalanine/L-methionine N-acetyltransferase